MASLIPGYEYDIFISYRQKDNKGEMWVSEFVEALKTELESTFKEEISVYFDVNPHEGLLETHDVDASLKEKLKCLIFIPILSRTYCDPKSFAWKNEFEAFVEQASKDRFGLKIVTPDGSTFSRVLPVIIHDLDEDDIKHCESVLGEIPKGVEFIYESPGINRPLRSQESKPDENLNKTDYRDQINKTALAINEILLGLKGEPEKGILKQQRQKGHDEARLQRMTQNRIFVGLGIVAILIIAVILTFPQLFKSGKLKKFRSSDGRIALAIMPFQNMTNDTTLDFAQDGVQFNLISGLSYFNEELKINQYETIKTYLRQKEIINYSSLSIPVARLAAEKLNADITIYGKIYKTGDTIRLTTQLIDAKTGDIIRSVYAEGPVDDLCVIADTLSVKIRNSLVLKKLQKDMLPSVRRLATTQSPKALECYILAKRGYGESEDMYKQAIRIDSNFTSAILSLTHLYLNWGDITKARETISLVYNKKDQLIPELRLMAEWAHCRCYERIRNCITFLEQLIQVDDQLPNGYSNLGFVYHGLNQFDKAIPYFEKVFEIFDKWGVKPETDFHYVKLAEAYIKTKHFRKAKNLLREAEKSFPDKYEVLRNNIILNLILGDTVSANKYIKKYTLRDREIGMSESGTILYIGIFHSEAGLMDKAEEYFRKAYAMDPDSYYMSNNLAWFLIKSDRNIKEGMEVVEQSLKIKPDYWGALDTKAWGYYKLGEYEKAVELLEKIKTMLENPPSPYLFGIIDDHLEPAKKALAEKQEVLNSK